MQKITESVVLFVALMMTSFGCAKASEASNFNSLPSKPVSESPELRGPQPAIGEQAPTDTQLEAVSWGKERPVATGHDEAAWAQNRRADIVYPKK